MFRKFSFLKTSTMSKSAGEKSQDDKDSVTRRLIRTRSLLLITTNYLADDIHTIKERVEWKHIGVGNRLLTKDSINAVKCADESNGDCSTDKKTSKKKSGTNVQSESDVRLEPALLSIIVVVDSNDCWVTPCGYWKGPTKVTKKFEDLKLTFVGKSPTPEMLAQDFKMAVDNSKTIMDEVVANDAKSTGFFMTSKDRSDGFRFRHAVFEVSVILC